MVEGPAAIPPDVLEAACSGAEAAAEDPAVGYNPVPSVEELAFSHGFLAFITYVAFHVRFHSVRPLQLCFMACVASRFSWPMLPLSFHRICYL